MGGRWFYDPRFGFIGSFLWVGIFAAFIGLIAWAACTLIRYQHRMAGSAWPVPPGRPFPSGAAGAMPHGPYPSGPAVPPGWGINDDAALTTARLRYARGEIDREQYFRVVEDLTGVPRPPQAAPSFTGPPAPPPPASPPFASPTPAPGPAGSEVSPGPSLLRPERTPESVPGWPPPPSLGGGQPGWSSPRTAGPGVPPTEGPEA